MGCSWLSTQFCRRLAQSEQKQTGLVDIRVLCRLARIWNDPKGSLCADLM